MTQWIKRVAGILIPPPINHHCVILILDRDGQSPVPLNAIFEQSLNTGKHFVLINDGIGEVIKFEQVIAYFTYDYTGIMETL